MIICLATSVYISSQWTGFDVDGTDDPNRDWRGLMMRHCPSMQGDCELLVDGVSVKFSCAPNYIKLGDYGHLTDSEDFCCEGNLFTDPELLSLKANITPRQLKISERGGRQRESDVVKAYFRGGSTELYKPLGLSLPNISSQRSYNVPLTLAGLAQTQRIGATLQNHLFGTEMKMLALVRER